MVFILLLSLHTRDAKCISNMPGVKQRSELYSVLCHNVNRSSANDHRKCPDKERYSGCMFRSISRLLTSTILPESRMIFSISTKALVTSGSVGNSGPVKCIFMASLVLIVIIIEYLQREFSRIEIIGGYAVKTKGVFVYLRRFIFRTENRDAGHVLKMRHEDVRVVGRQVVPVIAAPALEIFTLRFFQPFQRIPQIKEIGTEPFRIYQKIGYVLPFGIAVGGIVLFGKTDGAGMVEFGHVAVVGQLEPIVLLLPFLYEAACRYCYFCFIQVHTFLFKIMMWIP